MSWQKKYKGSGIGMSGAWIHTHPGISKGIVDSAYGVRFDGKQFDTVNDAKQYATRCYLSDRVYDGVRTDILSDKADIKNAFSKMEKKMFVEGNYVFGVAKQELAVDTKVVLGRTASDLDGRTGVILGKPYENVVDAYIVLLDEPYKGQKAILMTEVCLCPI